MITQRTLTVWFGFLAMVALFALPQPSQAATTLSSCQTINASGSYVLGQSVSASGTCFSIRASNVTFDGNGKTISSSSGDAVEVAHYSGTAATNVVVKNFTSPDGVRTYGDAIAGVTFESLNVSGVTVYGSDDVTIKNNTVGQGGINVSDADNNWPPYRPIVSHNTVTGGSTNVKILVELVGGKYHPCPKLDAQIINNTITDTRNDPPPEATAAVRIRCATHTAFTGNTVRSTGTTIGLYMRDESDYGTFSNNVFWTKSQEAFRSASGNSDKTFPAHNTFTNNVFRSDEGVTTFFQGIGGSNVFTNNLFWANTGGEGGTITAAGNTYDHNTFYNPLGSGLYMIYGSGAADTWTNNIFVSAGSRIFRFDGYSASRFNGDYNLYHQTNQTTVVGNGQTLAQWKTATGDDGHSLSTDPKFTSVATGDFSLHSSSPARTVSSNGSSLGQTGLSALGRVPTPSTSSSQTTPVISILQPKIATTVRGRVLVTTSVKGGSSGFQSAAFSIDGVKFSTDRTSPFRAWLDTRSLRNGYHRIDVRVAIKSGGIVTAYRGFYVKNALQIAGTTLSGSQTVKGVTTLKPKFLYGASTNIRVQVKRSNGVVIGTSTKYPYQVKWDTRNVRNGRYRLTMSVTDSTKKTATSSFWVRVRN